MSPSWKRRSASSSWAYLRALLLLGSLSTSPSWAASAGAEVRPARGSLEDEGPLARDVATLEHAWRARGEVVRGVPRLLKRGESMPVVLEPGRGSDCVSVAVLAARNVSFLVSFGSSRSHRGSLVSQAGLALVTRCGRSKADLAELTVQMRSPRGLVESLVALSDKPSSPVFEVLVERDPGPLASASSIGPRPALPAASQRALHIDRRARREGAQKVVRSELRADAAGRGSLSLDLTEGCHQIDVLADAEHGGSVDVDARLLDPETGEEVQEDFSESGHASLGWCLGRQATLRLLYLGAASRGPVLVQTASWPLPETLPGSWGARARGRIAHALGISALRSLGEGPLYGSLGVQGTTRLPWELEPGTCYTVAVATIRGSLASLALGVQAGPVRGENHGGRGQNAVALSFCNESAARGLIEVQSSGLGLAWLLGIWRTFPTASSGLDSEEKP